MDALELYHSSNADQHQLHDPGQLHSSAHQRHFNNTVTPHTRTSSFVACNTLGRYDLYVVNALFLDACVYIHLSTFKRLYGMVASIDFVPNTDRDRAAPTCLWGGGDPISDSLRRGPLTGGEIFLKQTNANHKMRSTGGPQGPLTKGGVVKCAEV